MGDQRTQSSKFKQAAKELGVELDEAQLRETLGKLAKHQPTKSEKDEPKGK